MYIKGIKFHTIEEFESLYSIFISSLCEEKRLVAEDIIYEFELFLTKTNESLEFSRGYIRGFGDGEGSVGNDFITFANNNIELLKKIKEYLLRFNITSSIYKLQPPKNTKHKQGYTLQINSRKNLLKFYRCIGFKSEDKQRKLFLLIKDFII
jgi:intein-encoded DNA endonuclease-like protein